MRLQPIQPPTRKYEKQLSYQNFSVFLLEKNQLKCSLYVCLSRLKYLDILIYRQVFIHFNNTNELPHKQKDLKV
jgi:hypothetical protein